MQFITGAIIEIEPLAGDSTLAVITRGDFSYDDVRLTATDALFVDQSTTLFGAGTVAILRITPADTPNSANATNGRSSAPTSKVVD